MADNKQMILNLFAELQGALFWGDRFAQGEFVSFLQPGQFVGNLQETAGSDDMAIQSLIANTLIDTSFVNKYKDTTLQSGTELLGSVDQVYEDIINQSALPDKALDAGTIAEMKSIEQWIGDNQANYDLWEGQFFNADDALQAEKSKQNPNPQKIKRLQQKRDDTENLFLGPQGHGLEYRSKMGRYLQLVQPSPSALWNQFRQRVSNQAQIPPTMARYLQTFLSPPIASWSTAGWAEYEKTISESDSSSYSKNTSWSSGASAGWGLWSFGGGTSGSTSFSQSQSSTSSVQLKFEYLRVRINRPWLVEDIFGYRFWTWLDVFRGAMISDGGNLAINPPLRPIGRMPILPRYLIVVRNLEMSAAFTKQEQDAYTREVKANASIGWGPFSVSGSYSESTGTQHASASFDGTTFRIQQPQIIARTGLMLPRCPHPDHQLPWKGDQWFPPDSIDQATQMLRISDYGSALEEELRLEARSEANSVAQEWRDRKVRQNETYVRNAVEKMKKELGAPPNGRNEGDERANKKDNKKGHS